MQISALAPRLPHPPTSVNDGKMLRAPNSVSNVALASIRRSVSPQNPQPIPNAPVTVAAATTATNKIVAATVNGTTVTNGIQQRAPPNASPAIAAPTPAGKNVLVLHLVTSLPVSIAMFV